MQQVRPVEMGSGRLLFVDFVRISGLALVLFHHLIGTQLIPSWIQGISINYLPYLFPITYGSIGAWLFIFASGCSLSLSNFELSSLSEIKSFYQKRFIRIYPIYWIALLFNIFIFNWKMPSFTIIDIAKWFSGFQVYLTTNWIEQGRINITYWFIGLILSLYLLYPLLFYAVKKRPTISLILFFFVSLASRYLLYVVFPTFSGGWDAFPLCRLFNFTLGIYLIQKGFFPRAISNRAVAFVCAMSFYVYLLQFPIICVTNYDGGIFYFVAGLIGFSFLLYSFDNFIRNIRFKRSTTKEKDMPTTMRA